MKKIIEHDFYKYLLPTVILTVIIESSIYFISIFNWKTVGDFSTNIINKNFDGFFKDFKTLSVALIFTLLIFPIAQAIKNIIFFNGCLKHDNIVFNHFIHKDILSVNKMDKGEICNRLESDVRIYRWTFISILTIPFIFLFSTISLIINLFSNSIIFAIICVISSFLPILATLISKKITSNYKLLEQEYNDVRYNNDNNFWVGYKFIKLNNIIDPIINRIDELFHSFYKKTIKKRIRLNSFIKLIVSIGEHGSKVIVIVVGLQLVATKEIEIGSIVSYLGYLTIIQDLFKNISLFIQEKNDYRIFLGRMQKLYENPETSGTAELNKINKIEIKNLNFSYNGIDNILKDLNLLIVAGKKIAITGKNGTGKTSLIKIISSLYRLYDGRILINDRASEYYDIKSIRKAIAFVEQDPFLFSDTINNNLRLADYDISDNDIVDILAKIKFEKPPNFVVHNNGSNLSGGEKQKLSIARCLLRKHDILVVDEPTNNLDADSSIIILELLRNEKNLVLVTHDKKILDIVDEYIEL